MKQQWHLKADVVAVGLLPRIVQADIASGDQSCFPPGDPCGELRCLHISPMRAADADIHPGYDSTDEPRKLTSAKHSLTF